ncbi:MAG: hypothetical protein EDR02_02015 [Actinobacteria bacterium]|nr:MAG: hypothetical protein EDR02_02015 [Actinomycetota bacterium]
MERDRTLRFTPIDHPDARLQRIGFDLSDPYVEQCWSAVVGPSSTLLLRRLPVLWVARVPAEIGASELSRSLGLGVAAGERSRLMSTLQRLVHFGLARPVSDGAGLDVYHQVAPLSPRQLARLPQWTRDAHERLFGAHLEGIERLASHRANVASITARLDHLQHGARHAANGVSPQHRALGR